MTKTEAAVRVLEFGPVNPQGEDKVLQDLARAHLLRVLQGGGEEAQGTAFAPEQIPGVLRAFAEWYDSPQVPPMSAGGASAGLLCRELADATEAALKAGGFGG